MCLCLKRAVVFIKLKSPNRLRSDKPQVRFDKPHIVRGGPRTSKEKVMFRASRIGWAGMAFTLLTTWMLVTGLPRSAAGSDFNKEGVAAFIIKNEITKMQETLRDKGHYLGKVDGLLGLRTRAGIRAYQKAESLPITGQVDSRTAEGLGVRPESTWDNPKSAGGEVGRVGDRAGDEMNRDKPSAGIRRVVRASRTPRKEVSRVTAIEDNRGDGADRQQAESGKHDQ
jgi:Putative peptidoglycan binding domain